MAAKSNDILIFGGTGVIGKYLTKALLNAKQSFGRIAIFTSASTAQSKASQIEKWKTQGLEVITGDLTNDQEVRKAYKSLRSPISQLPSKAQSISQTSTP